MQAAIGIEYNSRLVVVLKYNVNPSTESAMLSAAKLILPMGSPGIVPLRYTACPQIVGTKPVVGTRARLFARWRQAVLAPEVDDHDGAAAFKAAVGDVGYALDGRGEVELDIVEVGVGGGGGGRECFAASIEIIKYNSKIYMGRWSKRDSFGAHLSALLKLY
jgi:hypothetical protein